MADTFLDVLKAYGKSAGIRGGARGVLRSLHVSKKKTPNEIAAQFGVSATLVRVRLKAAGLYRQAYPGFEERVKKAGFPSVDDFFLTCGRMRIVDMGAKVGLTFGGIQHHYRKWLRTHTRRIGVGKK